MPKKIASESVIMAFKAPVLKKSPWPNGVVRAGAEVCWSVSRRLSPATLRQQLQRAAVPAKMSSGCPLNERARIRPRWGGHLHDRTSATPVAASLRPARGEAPALPRAGRGDLVIEPVVEQYALDLQ